MRVRSLALASIFILSGLMLLLFLFIAQPTQAQTLPRGITIHGYDFSGLSHEEALETLTELHAKLEQRPITLKANDYTVTTNLPALGYHFDNNATLDSLVNTVSQQSPWERIAVSLGIKQLSISPVYQHGADTTHEVIVAIEDEIEKSPLDMSLEYRDNTLVTTIAESGLSIDTNLALTAVSNQLRTLPLPEIISIPYTIVPPKIDSPEKLQVAKEQLEKLLAQPVTLTVDEFSTTLPAETLFSFIIFTTEDDQLTLTFDEEKTESYLSTLAPKIDRSAQTKKVSATDNSTITEGRKGRKLNVSKSAKNLIEHLKTANTTPVALAADEVEPRVVKETAAYTLGRIDGKYIEVDLSLQTLNLIDGNQPVRGFRVSTGKWSSPTPIGEFTIHNHHRTAWSKRYGLYMDHWMAITPDGVYGIHQLPRWPDGRIEGTSHIGTPVSHGCIRLAPGDAEYVYNWAENGTKVFIHQ